MKKYLGIEFGSTRIKSVLIDENAKVLAKGIYEWENILVDGLWSYNIEDVFKGMKESYSDLLKDYGERIYSLDAIGISGMMHGYIALDENDKLLAPFRTWRNTNTKKAADELSELFRFNIPMRWSVSQYYESVLEGLSHVKNVKFMTTLAGYVHYILTGEKVIGIGDASGMFPIGENRDYDNEMLNKFNSLLSKKGIDVDYKSILPKVMVAGKVAGRLTEEGAKILDESGDLKAGIPFCAPEGDMGTGMVCTNCVKPGIANSSLGTSSNLTVILEKNLSDYYPEIDIITTPSGDPAALIHTNTCTSVINTWVNLFNEVIELSGGKIERSKLFTILFNKSSESDENVGGITAYNFLAGEPIARTFSGAPMTAYSEDGNMNLANFMQAQIYSAIAVLSLGLDILRKENVRIDKVYGHGGYFKTPVIGQSALSALVKAPVTVLENAGEGGAFGIAVLALYLEKCGENLDSFLDSMFESSSSNTLDASPEECEKFDNFIKNYKKCLDAERLLTEMV